MKEPPSKPLSVPVPRLGSLLHRLQRLPAPEGKTERPLDQLMAFLADPPENTRDRWQVGAEMCAHWGIACTRSSVWRLYRSHVLEWNLMREAQRHAVESPETLLQRTAHLVAARTVEILGHPQLSAKSLIGFVRMEIRRQSLKLSREKHLDLRKRNLDLALETLADEVAHTPAAREVFARLRDVLHAENPLAGQVAGEPGTVHSIPLPVS